MSIQHQIIEFTNKHTVDNVIADNQLNAEFLELFHQIFEYYPECSTCGMMAGEYDKLKRWANGKLNYTPKSMANFILKKGRQVYVRSIGNMVTEFNLTDRTALIMLREAKGNINNFETAPENWEELLVELEKAPIPEIEAFTTESAEPTIVTEEVVEQTTEQIAEEVTKVEQTTEAPKQKFQKRK